MTSQAAHIASHEAFVASFNRESNRDLEAQQGKMANMS